MAETGVDIDLQKLDKVRKILGTESIREIIAAAFCEVIRRSAVRELMSLGELGPSASFLKAALRSPAAQDVSGLTMEGGLGSLAW